MKKYFLFVGALIFVYTSNAQQGLYKNGKAKEKNCFTEYYDAFVTRGALPVKDGEHNIIISLRTDTSCVCSEGKVNVKGGKIVAPVMVKKTDGTYEPSKKKLLSKQAKSVPQQAHLYLITNGMSQTFSTDDHYWCNLFFVDALKRKVVPNSTAPSPDDIAGVQPAELDEKEKELIKKTYEGLQFANGKTTILKASYGQLNLFADMLKDKKDYNLFLKGYTDNVGSEESNLKLSQGRADAVKDYLVNKGIDAQRITSEGFGMENPIGDNNTADGRSKNRRVEFIVVQ